MQDMYTFIYKLAVFSFSLLLICFTLPSAQEQYYIDVISNKSDASVMVQDSAGRRISVQVDMLPSGSEFHYEFPLTKPRPNEEPITYYIQLVDSDGKMSDRHSITIDYDYKNNSHFHYSDPYSGIVRLPFGSHITTTVPDPDPDGDDLLWTILVVIFVLINLVILSAIIIFFSNRAFSRLTLSNSSLLDKKNDWSGRKKPEVIPISSPNRFSNRANQNRTALPIVPGVTNLEHIIDGGMAHIYTGEIEGIEEKIIIKILKQDKLNDTSEFDLFIQESNTLQKLHRVHNSQVPGVVYCHGSGRCIKPRDTPYMLLEYLKDYCSLNVLLKKKRNFTEDETLTIVMECAKVLEKIHYPQKGEKVLHGDISTENIMLKIKNRKYLNGKALYGLKLIDFGAALIVSADRNIKQKPDNLEIRGKIKCIPPETWGENSIYDERSELYSLGIVMFELLAGEAPFVSTEIIQTAGMHLSMSLPFDKLPNNTSQTTLGLLGSLLAKDPQKRTGSATELVKRLAKITGHE